MEINLSAYADKIGTVSAKPCLPDVGQFNFVWADKTVSFGKMKFRVVGYCAYNAFGMIGTENNGIAILNENEKTVVTDSIHCCPTYMEALPSQRAMFLAICDLNENDFKEACVHLGRSRYA